MKRSLVPLLVILSLTSCAKNGGKAPIVQNMEQAHVQRVSIGTDGQPITVDQVISTVTLLKSTILGREFLYGSTLQTSSIHDGKNAVTMLGMAIGELPAEFSILDNKLRLMTDPRLNFESNINTPARLILEFKILAEDATTVTIQADKASPILDTFLFENKPGKPRAAKQASFIRSMEYVADQELFLIESTVEMVDGSVAEVMEHLIPRERIVPKDAVAIYADKDLNSDAARYRFLESDPFWTEIPGKGRVQTKSAQHWLLKGDQPVQWWVTRNVPDEYLNDIKNGVEGWNRYSQAANGKNIIQFMGKLPEGVKLGDIRYNVIAWDSVAQAGAAYESQNSDPFTGIQVNSLVYLPNAWVNIGKDYWKDAARTQAASDQRSAELQSVLKNRGFAGGKLPLNCMDNPMMHVTMDSKNDPLIFGRKLLRDTLFHEIGHSFGLAHNFKGSLSYDDSVTSPTFSTSIMEYNYYSVETAAYNNLDTSDGPLLEYDRQIISVLYNGKKDVKSTDPVVPTCADAEADSHKGGVDPLCIRYDIGKDPTVEALHTFDLLSDAKEQTAGVESLPKTIDALLTTLPPVASLKTPEDVKKAVSSFVSDLGASANLYIGGSPTSLANIGSDAMKSLYVAQKDILPAGYNENEMRGRAYSLFQTVESASELPQATKDSLANARAQIAAYVRSAASAGQMETTAQDKMVNDILAAWDKANVKISTGLLAKARAKLLGAVKYNADGPLGFLKTENGTTLDMEAEVLKAVEQSLSPKAGTTDRPADERMAAAQTLATFSKVASGQAVIERVTTSLNAEINGSQDALQRESLRKLLAAVKATPDSDDDSDN